MFDSLFSHNDQRTLIIDIGSGSVGAAIVDHEYKTRNNPEPCVWSKRLFLTDNGQQISFEQNLYNLKATLLNLILEVNSEGIAALFEQTDHYNITNIEVCVSAPWVHTTPKRIIYQKNKPFQCNKALIKQLGDEATNEAVTTLQDTTALQQSSAAILNNRATHLHINGYPVNIGTSFTTTACTFTHYTSLIDTQLQTAIQDLLEKSFPNTENYIRAFLPFFAAVTDRFVTYEEYSLIDITYDGTEIGVIRDHALTFATHFNQGIRTIAKESSSKQPTDTALSRLTQFDETDTEITASTKKAERSFVAAMDIATEKTTSGFAIPHHVILLVEPQYELFCTHLLQEFFTNTYDTTPKISTISSLLPKQPNVYDVTLQLLVTEIIADRTEATE